MSDGVAPALARVRPRVIAPGRAAEPVLLEEWVADRLAARRFGVVHLAGPPGAGKSTALAHLAARFADRAELALVDEGQPSVDGSDGRLVVVARPGEGREDLVVAPWTRDDLIEYVLASHRDRAASILARAGADSSGPLPLRGRPAAWAAVVDALAHDPDLPDLSAALERRIDVAYSRTDACVLGQRLLLGVGARAQVPAGPLLELEEVRLALMWRALLNEIEITGKSIDRRIPIWLAEPPLAVYASATRYLPARSSARRALMQIVMSRVEEYAGAASLLNAVDQDVLRPLLAARHAPARLRGAHLPGVNMGGLSEWIFAAEANLDGANLVATAIATVARAFLVGAHLYGALLEDGNLSDADLERADLSRAAARGANFNAATLRRADLTAGRFEHAKFDRADLRDACLDWAAFTGAVFTRARFEGASLHWADLSHARLDGVDLRGCRGQTATFHKADLSDAKLEGLHFEAPDFTWASLDRALLTDTRFPRADLRGATIVEAGLAGVAWAGADLRDTDLSRTSFHLGSSRSGLLFAGTSEGTRTGFYTEEMRDLAHKDPAEVRIADLRGVDLTGAHTDDTDWYRVDLRGARYDAAQRRHMAACGAILDPK